MEYSCFLFEFIDKLLYDEIFFTFIQRLFIFVVENDDFRPLLFDEILDSDDECVRQVWKVDLHHARIQLVLRIWNITRTLKRPNFSKSDRVQLLWDSAP